MREMVRITQVISDEEFERAKNQLKLQTMLQLDGMSTTVLWGFARIRQGRQRETPEPGLTWLHRELS